MVYPNLNRIMTQGKGRSFWFVLVIVLIMLMEEVNGLDSTQKGQITAGLEAGQAIAEFVSSKEFSKTMTKLASSASVYLGALGPFIGVVLAFIPEPDSAELLFMKKMMKNIDNRFDKLDSRFDSVERLIQWSSVKVNFGQIEQKILAMGKEYEFIYQVPKSAVQNRKTIFLANYNSDYQNSGTKLYQAITLPQGTFQEKLGYSVMRYTKNDRRETQTFLLGVMQLLLQAVKIELAFYQVQKFTHNAKFMQGVWNKRIQDVRKEFESVDRVVRDRYHSQSGKDLLEYAAANTRSSNKDFAKGLFNLLSGKYYWRDWIVLAYDDIAGWDKHTVSACGGHIKFRQNGRNIVVASVDNRRSIMNLGQAYARMRYVSMSKRKRNWLGQYRYVRRTAREVYDALNKSGACQVAVIKCKNGLHIESHTRRFKSVSRCPYFDINMWG